MSTNEVSRRHRKTPHPYLSGNFAPIQTALPLTQCTYTGTLPKELAGGQYVRNGGNPLTNDDLGRDAHWFDGDGMLSGVLFRRSGEKGTEIQPEFVNQYILTDLYLHAKSNALLRKPLLASIATLVNPLNSVLTVCLAVFRTMILVLLSHLPGSKQAVRRISVANTGILYHDGRALATCESGPPIRIQLPGLETVGWFNGYGAENERVADTRAGYGGDGPLRFLKEFTTGHPRVDPDTHELISFHSSFAPPYVNYSIVPPTSPPKHALPCPPSPARPHLDMPVPGIRSAKMMHDFGVSLSHTVIMDLPLSLDPLNLAKGKPVVAYDATQRARFGVFARHHPEQVRWFESNACCIFHTANCWTESRPAREAAEPTAVSTVVVVVVKLLVCRLTSASVVYSAGMLSAPTPTTPVPSEYWEEEQCRLYYYSFSLAPTASNTIMQQHALSTLAFEFPTLSPLTSMRSARYIYGCSNSRLSFSAALGRGVKIDYLAKMDVHELIRRGEENPPQPIKGAVDTRTIEELEASTDPNDPIKLFKLPEKHYAQEARFVPRSAASDDPCERARAEDDGFLVFYVFDESQLDATGQAPEGAVSELWVLDARDMESVLAKVRLPQRVPYGLHGSWFEEKELRAQRGVKEVRREPPTATETAMTGAETLSCLYTRVLLGMRKRVLDIVG